MGGERDKVGEGEEEGRREEKWEMERIATFLFVYHRLHTCLHS